MATDDIETDEETEEGGAPKRSRGPLLIGLVLFLLMGGGGFFGVYSGLVPLPGGKEAHAAPKKISYELTGEEPAFVEVGHMTIPLGPDAKAAFLHIDTQLEVAPNTPPISKNCARAFSMCSTHFCAPWMKKTLRSQARPFACARSFCAGRKPSPRPLSRATCS